MKFKPPFTCSVWFERGRGNVSLEDANGEEVFDLWDEELWEAIEYGFLTQPRAILGRYTGTTGADWLPHAIAYAVNGGLIEET